MSAEPLVSPVSADPNDSGVATSPPTEIVAGNRICMATVPALCVRVAGCSVTIVDIPGTYLDQPGGPFAGGPTVKRPGYRMLAAIVETPKGADGQSSNGNYFLKFYGPAATVERHAAGFQKMIEGMVPAGR